MAEAPKTCDWRTHDQNVTYEGADGSEARMAKNEPELCLGVIHPKHKFV